MRALVRQAYFVPESKRLDDLLREMQAQRVHMAIVVDEYGSVAGLVTIEDLVEEIIGDIQDEYDREEQLFERISDNEYIVDAKISLDELDELLDARADQRGLRYARRLDLRQARQDSHSGRHRPRRATSPSPSSAPRGGASPRCVSSATTAWRPQTGDE